MRIAVVDDLKTDRDSLIGMMERYFSDRRALARIDAFSTGGEFLAAFEPGRFQIMFLDIYLGDADGMEIARALRQTDRDCRLVFFTTSSAFAVDSYAVRASYYLTKPTQYPQLSDALDICTEGLLADSRFLEACVGTKTVRVLLRDILYLDCSGRLVNIHTADRVLSSTDSFSALSGALLRDGRFYLCHRGIVVNFDWVRQIDDGDFMLKTGELIPIRQRGRAEAKRVFLDYSLRDLR